MTIRDDVLQLLQSNEEGMTDAQLAAELGKLHQQINSRCRQLAAEGLIVRDSSSGVILNRLRSAAPAAPGGHAPEPSTEQASGPARGWPHESAVQGALVGWLARDGWRILRVADTETQERGTDVIAERNGTRLLVEVKGYPGTTYARGAKAGQAKPTPPTLQASHWLAAALLKAMRMRGADTDARVAVAMPDYPRYRSILSEIEASLRGAGVEVWLLSERGEPSTTFGDRAYGDTSSPA
ncbi:hypothetical protein GCM10009630_65030 [Kribbella jejuensis]|uniref:Uncharacterized protein n=1 Tax=Kribbella jejuensis TaxID=236068 RepID=A0A542ELY8_9ACTN|nr:hypothetical protein [Kribbella jejuensis]TQJ16362.1 hypothetical protein FB475_0456 [Kribbella jejuensis]